MARRERATVRGTARAGRRTKELARRLRPGDIAVIDHADLDPVAADNLVDSGVVAVINAAPSITGRYPNTGPMRIVRAGILLIDDVGPEAFDELRDGSPLVVEGEQVWCNGACVAKGERLTVPLIEERMEARPPRDRPRAPGVRRQHPPLRRGGGVAHLRAALAAPARNIHRRPARPRRGPGCRLPRGPPALRPYIAEYRPVLIGVDGGADALVDIGMKPDIVIGDFDSVSERALHKAADLVHHVHPDGRASGREELAEFGVEYEEFVVEGTSEDAAMLLAWEAGAKLVVAVGTHATMVEFLDKGRGGMASTFLSRASDSARCSWTPRA